MAKSEATAEAPKVAALPQPGPGEKVYAICYPKDAACVHVCAASGPEAWANFCDSTKQWPSPKLATVTEVK